MKPSTVVVCVLAVVILVTAAGHASHDQHVPPTTAHTTASVPTSPAPVVIDGTVEDYGTDPYTADCAQGRLVDVHPDTPAHRRDAAHLCQVAEQDWQTLETVARNGGANR
jgi:hypothetical protein